MEHRKATSNYDLQVDIARALFLKYDQEMLIRKFQLSSDPHWIYLTYLNAPLRICRRDGRIEEYSGNVWEECRSFNTVMTIFDLLCYSAGTDAPVLSGSWCSVGSFIVTGVQDAGKFSSQYAHLFQKHLQAFSSACQRLGGIPEKSRAGADLCYRIPVTPFFPVLLQFWTEDDEFPPKVTLMWDKNALHFLHFETTFYLQGDLLERIRRQLPQPDSK